MVLLASLLLLLLGLLQQFSLVLLFVVALVLLLEDACHTSVAQQLRVGYAIFYPFALIVPHLFSQRVLDNCFYSLLLRRLLPLPFSIHHFLPQPCFLNELGIQFLLFKLPLLLDLAVVLIDLFVLVIHLALFWLEVVVLHLLVHLLDLHVFEFAFPLLLVFLSQLHVQSVHHFFPEHIALFFVFFLGLQSYL